MTVIASALERHIHEQWMEYAALRFAADGVRVVDAWAAFVRACDRAFADWTAGGVAADFEAVHVRRAVLGALVAGDCVYCGALLGLENWAVGPAVPPCRGGVGLGRLANLVVCCRRCGQAKGRFTSEEWINIVATLRGCEDSAAADALDRLIFGGLALAGDAPGSSPDGRRRVLLTPRRPRVTREGDPRGRRRPKK